MSDTPTEPTSPTPGSGQPRPPINPAGTSSAPPPPPGYVPAVFVAQPSGKSAASKIVMYLLAVGLLVSITFNVYLFGPVKQLAIYLTVKGPIETPYYPDIEITGNTDRIVVVEVAGMIDGPTAEYCRQAFYRLEQDPPAAVVLRVESGGGGVTASDQIWHAIQNFRAKHPKVPLIASFGGIAASGGYYIAAPSDYIFCERTGITGSIGVLAQVPGAGGLIEKIGLEMNMVIANESPKKDDANNLFIEWYDDEGNLTPEGDDAIAVLKNLLNDAYEVFFEVVETGRQAADSTITTQELEAAANGGIFIGPEAVEAKLVDEIGYLDQAIAYAAKQAGVSGEPEVTYLVESTPSGIASLLGKREGADLSDVSGSDLRELMEEFAEVQLEYRVRYR